MKILVTGASGFVGRHLLSSLRKSGQEVISFGRGERPVFEGVEHRTGDESTDFSRHLEGVNAVVHAAGLAHQSGSPESLKKRFFEVNRDWTARIAGAVADSGVETLLHISSIAAAGVPEDRRSPGIRESDEIVPLSDYGKSKREAEARVLEALRDTGKLAVNVRPPLIYGRGTKGNWDKLCRLAKLPVPLPFASVRNRRSYLSVHNLGGFVNSVLSRTGETAQSGTYHVADAETLSLAEVVRAIRNGLGRSAGLIPFPGFAMELPLRLAGKPAMAEGLFSDLVVDSTKARDAFSWEPEIKTEAGMSDSVEKSG